MPNVYRMRAWDDDGVLLTEAWSAINQPSDFAAAMFGQTAERFFGHRENFTLDRVIACRRCGCTEDRACEGGCSWVRPDLCSRCAAEPE